MAKAKTVALALRLISCWCFIAFADPAFTQEVPTVEEFAVIDERPPTESQSKLLSIFPSSCAFFVYRYGDNKSSLGRIDHLKQDLIKFLGKLISNKTIFVKHYIIYVNARDTNLQGAAILTASDCPREDALYEYDRSRIPNTNPPVIAYLEVILDGEAYRIRRIFPADIDLTSQSAKRQADYLGRTMTRMHSALAELIAKPQ